MADRLAPLPRRILGLGMVALAVGVLGLCVAVYNKVFTERVPVTVHIASVDNSFLPDADVRVRGVTVGTVDSAETRGDVAVLHLELDPARVPSIPRNVEAMIQPKSLFGESYLALVPTASPSREHIMAGDDIPRDRSGKAVQVEQLFRDLVPLLRAVRPADLANTLGAVNQALSGRGAQLGDTITQLHQFVSRFNPVLPDLGADIRALPPVTETQSRAAPDLIEALRNLNTTSNTLVQRRADFEDLFGTVTDASDDLRGFLDKNGDNIIRLADTAGPTLDLLARYSPEFRCFFRRLSDAVPPVNRVFGAGDPRPALHIKAVITAGRGPYRPHRDEPEFTDDRGPSCYDNTPIQRQYPGGPVQDGSTHPPAATPPDAGPPILLRHEGPGK